MQIFSFAPSYPTSFLERLVTKVDSYFDLGEEKTVLITTARNLHLCIDDPSHISMCSRIIKILSYLFFPALIIAFLLRKLLHSCFYKIHKSSFLTLNASPQNKAFLIAHPALVKQAAEAAPAMFFQVAPVYQEITLIEEKTTASQLTFSVNFSKFVKDYPDLVKEAFETAPLLFFRIPAVYRTINLINNPDGSPKKLIYDINIRKIAEGVLTENIELAAENLKVCDQHDPHIKRIITQLIKEETGSHISKAGKRKLLLAFLNHLFISGVYKELPDPSGISKPWTTFFPYKKEAQGLPEHLPHTIWHFLFLEKFGDYIFNQLKTMGLLKHDPLYTQRGVRIYWH